MLRMRLKKAAVIACTAILATGTVGEGNVALGAAFYGTQSSNETVKGRILVSAGPDISISYNKNGKVLEIKGIDKDGKNFLEGQDGYVGKSCKDAVERLVRRLDEDGWFDRKTGNSKRSLVIKSEKGSQYPNDNFMNDIENEVRDLVEKRGIDTYIKVVGSHNVNDKGYIDRETAEKMVLEQLGLKSEDLRIKEYDLDDGVYEIEVWIKGNAHEIELNAVTGEVLNIERDDDNDGRFDDDRYDDDHDDDDRYDDDRYDDDHDDDDRYDDDRYDDEHDDDDRDDDDD